MTARKTAAIAAACRAYLDAHARRNANCQWDTPREREALAALEYAIAAPEREEASPLSETAA